MNSFKRSFGFAACGVAFASALGFPAQAATLVAGPTAVLPFPGAKTSYCDVLNTSTHTVTVTIEALNENGFLEAQQKVTLPPEQGTSVTAGKNATVCRFSGPSKNSMTGAMISRDPISGNYSNAILAQ